MGNWVRAAILCAFLLCPPAWAQNSGSTPGQGQNPEPERQQPGQQTIPNNPAPEKNAGSRPALSPAEKDKLASEIFAGVAVGFGIADVIAFSMPKTNIEPLENNPSAQRRNDTIDVFREVASASAVICAAISAGTYLEYRKLQNKTETSAGAGPVKRADLESLMFVPSQRGGAVFAKVKF
jgi:hypothetical protein